MGFLDKKGNFRVTVINAVFHVIFLERDSKLPTPIHDDQSLIDKTGVSDAHMFLSGVTWQ